MGARPHPHLRHPSRSCLPCVGSLGRQTRFRGTPPPVSPWPGRLVLGRQSRRSKVLRRLGAAHGTGNA
eukprot:9687884-Lingulodinium_polyedra.AAC.1